MIEKPKLAVFKFASCDGCQLSLLSVEDEILDIAKQLDIAYFLEATSRIQPGPYDIALVEGSITTEEDQQRIQQVRKESRYLITIGACATAGGIQALRNWADSEEWVSNIYASPEFLSTLPRSTPIANHVKVDFELRGCPINRFQLIEVIQSVVNGKNPRTPNHCVCLECKLNGNVCITVAQGTPCLGPVTQAGCGAICPEFNRGCYGCFGPAAQPNVVALSGQMSQRGMSNEEITHRLRSFNSTADEFSQVANRLESDSENNP